MPSSRGGVWLALAASLLHGTEPRGSGLRGSPLRGSWGGGEAPGRTLGERRTRPSWLAGRVGRGAPGSSPSPACSEPRAPRSLHPKVSLQGEFQRKLYKELIKNYNPLERPVANDSQPLTVYFSLSLLQIMDVVSLRGTLGLGSPPPAGAGVGLGGA